MARFRCRDCGYDGDCEAYDGELACPSCGSSNGQMAMGIEDIPEETWARMRERLDAYIAENDDGTEVELIYGPDCYEAP